MTFLQKFLAVLLAVVSILTVCAGCTQSDPGASTGGTAATDPSDPINQTNPTDSNNQTDSTDPSDQTEATDPTNQTNPENPTDPTDPEEKPGEFTLTSLKLPGINSVSDIDAYAAEVDRNGAHYNEQIDDGIIYSPYFELTVNGKAVEVYATRTSIGAHSFAYVDVDSDNFRLDLDLEVKVAGKNNVIVLPQKHGVDAEIENGHVTCAVDKTGSFSFVFNGSIYHPFTLIVRQKPEFTAPAGYTVKKLAPGTHDRADTTITQENTVLYFEKGIHHVHCIELTSNSIVYFEDGAYILAIMPKRADEVPWLDPAWSGKVRWQSFIYATECENIKILGRGVLDFSPLEWHARCPVTIDRCYDVQIEGLTLVNAPEWNLTCRLSSKVRINGVVIWGYRQNSDGICMQDSNDCIIENCFARSGDDLFEVKTCYGVNEKIYNGTPGGTTEVGNITFRNCDAWPDKARGYGIIHESTRSITNCTWEGCTIGFASATWMDQLGCLMVLVANSHAGTNTDVVISDIHFNDIEIYSAAFYPINVTFNDANTKGQIKDVYFSNIRINGTRDIRFANFSNEGRFGNIYFDDIYRNNTRVKGFVGSAGLMVSYGNTSKDHLKLNTLS